MEGLLAPLLKAVVKKYLKDRLGKRFTTEEYETLAEEFKKETTNEEFSDLRRSDGEERRELVRSIARRIEARVKKTGTKEEKAYMRKFAKARRETSTTAKRTKGPGRKRGRT
jgi:2,3-bisphosphoglycerate-independent phosphoglycerate mutase